MKGFFEEAREEGREEAREEAREEMKRLILRCLRHRFQTVPKTLEKKILSSPSREMLEEIFDMAMDAQSLREFTTCLKEIQQRDSNLALSGK